MFIYTYPYRAYLKTKIICETNCLLWCCCGTVDEEYYSFKSMLKDEVEESIKKVLLTKKVNEIDIYWTLCNLLPK